MESAIVETAVFRIIKYYEMIQVSNKDFLNIASIFFLL